MTKQARNISVFQAAAIHGTILLECYGWFHWNKFQSFSHLLYVTSGGNHNVQYNNCWQQSLIYEIGLPLPVTAECPNACG